MKCSFSRSFHYMSFGVLSIGAILPGSSHRAPIERERERDAPFPEPSFVCLSKPPVKQAPSTLPNGARKERGASCPDPVVYSFIRILGVPSQGAFPRNRRENIRSPSTKHLADGRPTYRGVVTGCPRGWFTALQLLPQYHVAFSTIPSTLAWVYQSPIRQRVS